MASTPDTANNKHSHQLDIHAVNTESPFTNLSQNKVPDSQFIDLLTLFESSSKQAKKLIRLLDFPYDLPGWRMLWLSEKLLETSTPDFPVWELILRMIVDNEPVEDHFYRFGDEDYRTILEFNNGDIFFTPYNNMLLKTRAIIDTLRRSGNVVFHYDKLSIVIAPAITVENFEEHKQPRLFSSTLYVLVKTSDDKLVKYAFQRTEHIDGPDDAEYVQLDNKDFNVLFL